MKTFLKSRFVLVILVVLAAVLMVAFDGPEDAFTAAQWVIVSSVAMPILAQVVRLYVAKGGRKISGHWIDLAIMGVSLILVFTWGDGLAYIDLQYPVYTDVLPENIDSILLFAGSILGGIASIFGRAYLFFTALKFTVFDRVPFLKP